MTQRARLKVLMLATVAVWTAAIGTLARKSTSAKPPVTVHLTTEPRVVKIVMRGDRTPSYAETPTKIALAPGRRNRLKVVREGYIAHEFTVEGDSGDEIDVGTVVLERDPAARFARLAVRFDAKESGKEPFAATVEVDDGLVRGAAPLEAEDLVVGVDRLATFALEGDERKVRCRFTLEASHQEAPFVFKVRRVKGKGNRPDLLRVTPCQKPVERPRPRIEGAKGG